MLYCWHLGRSKQGGHELDLYLSTKHDLLLNKLLQPNTYKKMYSLAIVDGFAVQMTKDQVSATACNAL